MWIIISLLIISSSGVYPQIVFNFTEMRWVDNIVENDMEIMYDRAVIITVKGATPKPPSPGIALGVLIRNDTVLTSYNPFRMYINSSESKSLFTISVLNDRHITGWENVTYNLANYSIVCGRQVIPTSDNENIWHNAKQEHSPLHDLMVLRLDTGVVFLDPDPKYYSFDNYGKSGTHTQKAGPLQTDLATPSDRLGRDMKFASLGFIDMPHMKRFTKMRSHSFISDDNVLTNCDNWLPRQWGVFLCVRNIQRFKGLGSGALLFQNYMLFGIGCFMLKKGKNSILVFTDVRPYYHLINETCSWEDQNLQKRTTTTTTTTTTTAKPD